MSGPTKRQLVGWTLDVAATAMLAAIAIAFALLSGHNQRVMDEDAGRVAPAEAHR
jgi:hypothetical protein